MFDKLCKLSKTTF